MTNAEKRWVRRLARLAAEIPPGLELWTDGEDGTVHVYRKGEG